MFNLNSIAPPETANAAMQLLAVLGDPVAAKKMISDIVAARDEALAAAKKLSDLQRQKADLDRDRAAHEALVTKHADDHAEASARVARHERMLAQADEAHARKVAELVAERAAFEAAKQVHADKLAAVEKFKAALG